MANCRHSLDIFALGIVFGIIAQKNNKSYSERNSANTNSEIVEPMNINSSGSNANESKLSDGDIEAIFESLPAPDRKSSKEIKWQTLRQIPSLGIFNYSSDSNSNYREKSAKYYKVGEFIDGEYKGGDLILTSAPYEGPAFYPGFYRFAKKGRELFLLKNIPMNYTIWIKWTNQYLPLMKTTTFRN